MGGAVARRQRPDRASLDTQSVREATFRRLLILTAGATLAYWFHLGWSDRGTIVTVAVLLAVLLLVAALYWLGLRWPRLARVAFVAALYLGIWPLMALSPEAAYLLAVAALVAGGLVHVALAPALALLSVPALHLLAPEAPALASAVTAAAGLVGFTMLAPLYSLLRWHSSQSLEAVRMAEELREQRGRLNRTVKDLNDSYQLLQATNRQLAEARQEADRLRDLRSRFATNLSHELRTPLNIILGFAQLLYLRPSLYGYRKWNEDLRRDLGQIQRSAAYLSELVDDIVDLARVDALAMPISRQVTGLAPVIDDVVATAATLAQDKQIAIDVAVAPDLPEMLIDRVRVRQVLFNLITNAIRYTDAGRVSVSARREGREVWVSVHDTGRGIPEEELAHIFDEFYQVGRPKSDPAVGKGLGLAIAKRFVQLHGGRIWVTSRPGEGSTFAFSLPIRSVSVGLLRQSGPAGLPGHEALTVAVANDDGMACAYLKRRLPRHEFTAVPTADDLASRVQQGQVRAVLYNRPIDQEADRAWEEALELAARALPVMSCSLPGARWISGNGQFAAVLTKPVDLADLTGALERTGHGGRALSVLVVDDDRGFVQLVSRMLQASESGHEMDAAYDGRSALRAMRRRRPDVVLMDLRMPEMSGFEVLAEMREDPELRQVPVIAVTAATPGEDRLPTQGTSFSYVHKGEFRVDELVKLISAGVELAGAASEPAGEEQ